MEAAQRCRNAQRTGLIAADRHVDLAGGHQRAASRRRAAGGISLLVRVLDRTRGRGVAAAGVGKILGGGLAGDLSTGVEHARDDGCIDVRHIPLDDRCAGHHRHAGDTDRVLQHDPLARQLAPLASLDRCLDVPCAVLVFLALGPVAGGARIFHLGQVVRHPIDNIVGPHRSVDETGVRFDVVVAQMHAHVYGQFAQLLARRAFDRHGILLLATCQAGVIHGLERAA